MKLSDLSEINMNLGSILGQWLELNVLDDDIKLMG